jgi:NDP-sugar pyrophosphorylase family protein
MEAIILAGGFGTRLRPLTYTRAKSLLPILNKPMIIHLIDLLPSEVDKVILAVNYRKDQIEEYFNKHDCGKEIIINDEKTPLGTGGATKFAEKHITGRFLVLNSDIICSLNINEMINFHKKNNSATTISLWHVKNVTEFGVADVQKDGKIIGFVEKPKLEDAPSDLINAGAYLLEPLVLDYIQKDRLVSMEKEIFPQIIKDTDMFYGFKFKGYWMDIGRISSYLEINRFLLDKKNLEFCKGFNCKINGVLKKSTIGKNVQIGDKSDIKESIIFNNAKIGNNVVLSNCVIGENSKVYNNCKLKYVIVGDNEKIQEKTNLENTIIWNQPKPKNYPDKQIGNPITN